MTIKEVIEKLSAYPQDTKVFSFNEDDQIWSEGVIIRFDEEFGGVLICDNASGHGYWYSESKGKWVLV